MKLNGLNALITGASQGLGRVISEQYLREGANVVLCARTEGDLVRTQLALQASFPQRKVLARACDVSDETQVKALAAFALEELGSLQVLVLNAGVYGPMGPTEAVDLTEWRRAVDINLFGVLLPCRALIPHLKTAGRAKIIVLSGGGATNPLPNISAYAASKAAVVRLMETLAEELKTSGIDVNAIAPGALATRFVDDVLAAGPEKVGAAFYEKNKQWKEKGATPLELGASLAVYLASPESDGITGKLLSAQWDPWRTLQLHRDELARSDIYCLRRIVPEDRGKQWTP
ncbi:MAG TPA: SDR family oxidoreductase [Verrucomicrobiae bacterium]|jgi:NAD(P)-dependent dehydrogenase (short-subunit alcohol dehydrogenase family)|nr:SDR family oxidoreductase [Verrucomicrobiae bacterium]